MLRNSAFLFLYPIHRLISPLLFLYLVKALFLLPLAAVQSEFHQCADGYLGMPDLGIDKLAADKIASVTSSQAEEGEEKEEGSFNSDTNLGRRVSRNLSRGGHFPKKILNIGLTTVNSHRPNSVCILEL